MTDRDEFAKAALQSFGMSSDYKKGPCNAAAVERAYVIADLMLRERDRKRCPCGGYMVEQETVSLRCERGDDCHAADLRAVHA